MDNDLVNNLYGVAKSFDDMVFFHKFFLFFFMIPFISNLFILFTYKNFVSLNKKIWFNMPMIFFLSAVSLFSGIVIIFFTSIFHMYVGLMIVFNIYVIAGEIYRRKMLQKAMRVDNAMMLKYVKFAKILYGSELICFICLMWPSLF